MTTNVKRRYGRALTLLILSITVATCTRGNNGIFATIAIERRSTSRNLNNKANILGVAQTNRRVFSLTGRQVFRRDLSSDTWSAIATPSVGGGGGYAAGLVGLTNATAPNGISEEIYVLAQRDGGTRTAVFRISDSGYGPIVLDSAGPGSPGTIGGMQAVKDKLVVSVKHGDGSYRLYSFDAGFSGWAAADNHPLPTTPTTPPISYRQHIVDSDASATTAVFVGASGGLFRLPLVDLGAGGARGTALTALDPVLPAGVRPGGIDFGSNVAVGGTARRDLWVVTDRGTTPGRIFINESADPSSGWIAVDTEARLSFSDALWVDGSNATLLVGTFTNKTPNPDTLAGGLRIITLTRTNATAYSGTVSRSLGRSYRAVELSNASIRSLDLIGTTVYAQTSGSGLWSIPSFAETAPDNREWIWE